MKQNPLNMMPNNVSECYHRDPGKTSLFSKVLFKKFHRRTQAGDSGLCSRGVADPDGIDQRMIRIPGICSSVSSPQRLVFLMMVQRPSILHPSAANP